ncbi:MAG: hypothetical protein ABIL09_15930 [Gemmatimonadota bacterium]
MRSIAIAGAWGYIGRKLTDAALELGLETSVLDPGPPPPDAPLDRVTRLTDEEAFYRLPADLFHLALHPEHRGRALDILLGRARTEPILVLNEKPMAHPERPGDCQALVDAVSASGAAMLFDFPELFDPLTLRILDFLGEFDRVSLCDILVQRSKDREDRENPRNRKRMVHIQYQESVHCIAFALHLLSHCRRSAEAVLTEGVAARATSEPYDPPNPEDYPYVVDGRCDYELAMGGATLRGCTNFKRGARWEKSRLIRGTGDGRDFTIEADYLEGAKYLRLDGIDQGMDPDGSSYTGVLTTLGRWASTAGRDGLMAGLYPNPAFTRLTYQLSSLVWRSCFEGGARLQLGSASELVAFQAGFAEAASRFGRY